MKKIVPMTFGQMKSAAANDLREVAKLIEKAANEVDEGNMDAFYDYLVEGSAKQIEMLVIRQAHRAERYQALKSGSVPSNPLGEYHE